MNHLESGYVVPVWATMTGEWKPAWAKADRSLCLIGDPPPPQNHVWVSHPSHVRPRDPNRADGSDRPDLLKEQQS